MKRSSGSQITSVASSDPTSSRRTDRIRILLPVVLIASAFAFLAVRARMTLVSTPERVFLSDNIQLSSAPPLPEDDHIRLKEKLAELERARVLAFQQSKEAVAQLRYASEAMDVGDLITAREAYQAALTQNPTIDPVAYEGLGQAQIDLGLCSEALQTFNTLIKRYPTDVQGYVGLSRVQDLQHHRLEATQTLERGAQHLALHDSAGHIVIAKQFEAFGDVPRALIEAQAARGAGPDDPDAVLMVTHLLIKLERPQEARPLLEALLAKDGNNPKARYQLAVVADSPLAPKSDSARAESYLLETIQKAPQDTPAYKRLGELYQEQHRYRQAAYVFTQLLNLVPDLAEGRLQLSYAYMQMGDKESGRGQQSIASSLIKRDQEEAHLLTQSHQHPEDPQVRLRLADHYIGAGQFGKALRELQAAYSLRPSDSGMRERLNKFYRQIGLTSLSVPSKSILK